MNLNDNEDQDLIKMDEDGEENDYQKLENEYLQKLNEYITQRRLLNEEYNNFINKEDTSVKNVNYKSRNVFVSDFQPDINPISMKCRQFEENNGEITDWSLVSSSNNYSTCKEYAILNNKQYYGTQNIDGKFGCFVNNNNNNNNNFKEPNLGYPKKYWNSSFENELDGDKSSSPNVFVLGYDGLIYLMNYKLEKPWWNENYQKIYWKRGEKYEGCSQIWGGTITGISAVYGENCRQMFGQNGWNEYYGTVSATEEISKKYLHTDGQVIPRVSNDTFGGSQFDPCVATGKDVIIGYTCGDTNNLNIIKSREYNPVDLNCNSVLKNCPASFGKNEKEAPILLLKDDGDLCIYKNEREAFGHHEPSWCLSNEIDASFLKTNMGGKDLVHGVFKSGTAQENGIQAGNYQNNLSQKNLKAGTNFIRAGEAFQIGSLLASKNGAFALVLNQNGSLELYYAQTPCSENKSGEINGNRKDILNVSKFQINNLNNLNNLGKIGYVEVGENNEGIKEIREYPPELIKISEDYESPILHSLINTNDSEMIINMGLEDCKKNCQDMGNECLGLTWMKSTDNENEGTCYKSSAKDYNTFLGGIKTSKDNKVYYKKPKVINDNSCSKNIENISNTEWYNYDIQGLLSNENSFMTIEKNCHLAKATEKTRHNLEGKYEELNKVVEEVERKLNNESIENKMLTKAQEDNVKNLRKLIAKFKQVWKKDKKEKEHYNFYKRSMQDSELKLFSNNNKYLVWSLLLISITIFALSLIK